MTRLTTAPMHYHVRISLSLKKFVALNKAGIVQRVTQTLQITHTHSVKFSILGCSSSRSSYSLNSSWDTLYQVVINPWGISRQAICTASHNSCSVSGCFSFARTFRTCHRFSMGFASGNLAGHSKTVTSLSRSHCLVEREV